MSLNLNIVPSDNELNLELLLDPSSSSSSSNPSSPIEPRVFSCNYCRRKFYSSQALGGHQNAHKLERTLAKKSRELSSAVRPHHAGWNQRSGSGSCGSSGSSHVTRVQLPVLAMEHAGKFGAAGEMSYGRREMNYDSRKEKGHWIKGYNKNCESVHEEFGQLDLSLRL